MLGPSVQTPYLTFEDLFVLLSRVTIGAHCKILPHQKGFDHLCKLRPNPYMVAYYLSFAPESDTFSPELAKAAMERFWELENKKQTKGRNKKMNKQKVEQQPKEQRKISPKQLSHSLLLPPSEADIQIMVSIVYDDKHNYLLFKNKHACYVSIHSFRFISATAAV